MDRISTTSPACALNPDLFLHPFLEEPAQAKNAADRQTQRQMTRQAQNHCLTCPLLRDCLYRAVVDHDVSGYCAATTQRQRNEIRRRLDVSIGREDFGPIAGAASRTQINHNSVIELRQAFPNAPLAFLARRLGCSISTVKRHLRDERNAKATPAPAEAPAPSSTEVFATFCDMIGIGSQERAA